MSMLIFSAFYFLFPLSRSLPTFHDLSAFLVLIPTLPILVAIPGFYIINLFNIKLIKLKI